MISRGLLLFFIINGLIFPQKPLHKITGEPSRSFLNSNIISTVFYNNGISDFDGLSGNSGLSYPKGSGRRSVFESGFIWGLKIPGDTVPRIGGSTYNTGLQPGKITNSGLPWSQLTAEDPASPNVRVFRVRRDIYPGGPVADLTDEIRDEGETYESIRLQYETDWNEWPASSGAPFEDINGSGTYEPAEDIPGYPGAAQTIWYSANDLDSNLTKNLYGSLSVGMELQVTTWCYNNNEILNHIYFKQHKIINKSSISFNDVYISLWSDADIGNATDDFAGCDTLLNLGYIYNAEAYDNIYENMPTSAGYSLLRGPFNGEAHLPMTAFFYLLPSIEGIILDPWIDDLSREMYYLMQGKTAHGQNFVNPITHLATTYTLNGDPLTNEGWVDGLVLPEGDRRAGVCSGPFNMAPNDTQTIVTASIIAGGIDRDNSIKLLRYYTSLSKDIFENSLNIKPVPPNPAVTYTDDETSITLSWDSEPALVNVIENFNEDGYAFEGYNVYQL